MTSFAKRRARFNRRVTNPLVRPISGWVSMWSIVEHVGRRSGKSYRTPVSIFRTDDGVAVLLPYGTDTDWVRNVQGRGRRSSEAGRQDISCDQPADRADRGRGADSEAAVGADHEGDRHSVHAAAHACQLRISPSPFISTVPGITLNLRGVRRNTAKSAEVGPPCHCGMIPGS